MCGGAERGKQRSCDTWEISVVSAQFFYKPKIALTTKSINIKKVNSA